MELERKHQRVDPDDAHRDQSPVNDRGQGTHQQNGEVPLEYHGEKPDVIKINEKPLQVFNRGTDHRSKDAGVDKQRHNTRDDHHPSGKQQNRF